MQAHLHCYSLSNLDWRLPEINITYENVVMDKQTSFYTSFNRECFELREAYPDQFGQNIDELPRLIQPDEHLSYVYSIAKNMGLPEVFCHGNFHGGNMIFRRNPETGEAGDEILAVVDWQVCLTHFSINFGTSLPISVNVWSHVVLYSSSLLLLMSV